MTKAEMHQNEFRNSFNVHDDLKEFTYEELVEVTQLDRLPWTAMVINVSGNLNVSNIIRTSHILGAERVIIYGKPGYDSRGCVGADKYIEILKIEDTTSLNDVCNQFGLYAIFCETGGQSYRDFIWPGWYKGIQKIPYIRNRTPCIIVGSESSGLDPELIRSVNERMVVSIPQRGVLRSMNVSSAFAIIASHITGEIWS